MWMVSVIVGFYGLGSLVTLAHLRRTDRPGPAASIRQAAVAIAWPAYWGLVHGPSGTVRFARRQVRRAAGWGLRRLGRTAHGIFGALRRSIPVRYGVNYAACRRGGLSRRRSVAFAWILLQRR